MRALFAAVGLFCLLSFAACADEGGTFTGNNPANCSQFCAKLVECNREESPDACASDCADIARQASAVSSTCLSAFGTVNSCVSGLTCEQGQAWIEEVPPDAYPCKAEDDAAIAACNPG